MSKREKDEILPQVSMVSICRNASPAIGSTCRSSSLRVTVTYRCPSRP
jgi:hypothetical protein